MKGGEEIGRLGVLVCILRIVNVDADLASRRGPLNPSVRGEGLCAMLRAVNRTRCGQLRQHRLGSLRYSSWDIKLVLK
jgi:hypothetical protein